MRGGRSFRDCDNNFPRGDVCLVLHWCPEKRSLESAAQAGPEAGSTHTRRFFAARVARNPK